MQPLSTGATLLHIIPDSSFPTFPIFSWFEFGGTYKRCTAASKHDGTLPETILRGGKKECRENDWQEDMQSLKPKRKMALEMVLVLHCEKIIFSGTHQTRGNTVIPQNSADRACWFENAVTQRVYFGISAFFKWSGASSAYHLIQQRIILFSLGFVACTK